MAYFNGNEIYCNNPQYFLSPTSFENPSLGQDLIDIGGTIKQSHFNTLVIILHEQHEQNIALISTRLKHKVMCE